MSKETAAQDRLFSGLPLSEASMTAYDSAIRHLVSPQIMLQAERIVAAHRPEGILPGGEPLCMAGLKPAHHGDLNRPTIAYPGGKKAREKRIADLRAEYSGDKVAQQQIDVYADDTEYHNKLQEFVQALKTGDSAKESELDAWFKENYPDI